MTIRRWTTRWAQVLLVGIMCMTVLAAPAERASAGSTTLCSNGWACGGGGYSASSRSWADTYYYAGIHNCTRYAAHRLAKNGLGNPGRSWGNAWEWATRAPGRKDSTPAVGAIAHWGKSSARPSGHVAYVEEVGSGYVVITEDNYSGVTQRKKLTPGAGWPDRFIHIKDVAAPPPPPPSVRASLPIRKYR
jgi:surface antigen